MEKIIAIVGPTSSGKTDLSLRLAKTFKGRIISADSRQVYRGFDLCSGKISKQEMGKIEHYLLDIASPRQTYTVANFKNHAWQAIKKIIKSNRLPIIVGGTGLYIDTLINDQNIPQVLPNRKLRRQLEAKSAAELFKTLKNKDPERAKTIDPDNPRRLIRALEIIQKLGKVPKLTQAPRYQVLFIGLNPDKKILRARIKNRLAKRLKQGMVSEIKNLHDKQGLSWERLEGFGLELKYVSLYLQGRLSRQQMEQDLETAIWRYAKRQLTWFKRNKKINWVKNTRQAEKLLKIFLKEKPVG